MIEFVGILITSLLGAVLIGAGLFIVWATFSMALRLRQPWLRRLVVGGFSLLLALALIVCVWGFIAAQRLHREIARITEAGEPIVLAEPPTIRAVVPGRKEPDARSLYAAAIALHRTNLETDLEALDQIHRALRDGQELSLTAPQREALDAILEANAESMALLDRATALDHATPLNAERNSFFMLNAQDGLGAIRRVVNLASHRAIAELADGRHDDAANSVLAIIRGHRMLKEDSLVGHMLKVAIISLGAERVGWVVQHEDASSEKLLDLASALREAEEGLSLIDALMGERVVGLALMGVVPGATPAPTAPLSLFPWPIDVILAADYLRYMREVIDASRRPLPDAIKALPRVKPRGLFASALRGSFGTTAKITGHSFATLRAARLAIACELYRREHGKLPESLAELVPDYLPQIPADPFDGQPMRYRRDAGTVLLYSVGENGADDWGDVERSKRGESQDWGVRVRLEPRQ